MDEVKKYTFFRSYWDALSEMKSADRLAVIDAMMAYAFDNKEPELRPGPQMMAFTLIRPNIDSSISNSKNGQKGGRPQKDKLHGEKGVSETKKGGLLGLEKGSSVRQKTDKEKDVDIGFGNGKGKGGGFGNGSKHKFIPPSLEEVRSYVNDNKLNIDPEKWWHYYNARDWQFNNGQRMKNWKSAVQTWKKGDYNADSSKNNGDSHARETKEDPAGWEKIFG